MESIYFSNNELYRLQSFSENTIFFNESFSFRDILSKIVKFFVWLGKKIANFIKWVIDKFKTLFKNIGSFFNKLTNKANSQKIKIKLSERVTKIDSTEKSYFNEVDIYIKTENILIEDVLKIISSNNNYNKINKFKRTKKPRISQTNTSDKQINIDSDIAVKRIQDVYNFYSNKAQLYANALIKVKDRHNKISSELELFNDKINKKYNDLSMISNIDKNKQEAFIYLANILDDMIKSLNDVISKCFTIMQDCLKEISTSLNFKHIRDEEISTFNKDKETFARNDQYVDYIKNLDLLNKDGTLSKKQVLDIYKNK